MTKSRHYTLTCLSSSCSKAPRLSFKSLTPHFSARSTTSCQLSLITNHHGQTDTQTEWQTQTPYLDLFVQFLLEGSTSLLEEPDSTARSMTSCHMSLINNQHKQTDTHTYITYKQKDHTNRMTNSDTIPWLVCPVPARRLLVSPWGAWLDTSPPGQRPPASSLSASPPPQPQGGASGACSLWRKKEKWKQPMNEIQGQQDWLAMLSQSLS